MIRRLPVLLSEQAVADLEAIAGHILGASGSEKIASGFATRIRQRCKRIGDVPHGGRPRNDLSPGLRTVPFEHSAVIAYIIDEDSVRITNVFYGGRDFEALFRD